MAQVNMPNVRQPDDALTVIAKGLGIAQQVYGIKTNISHLEQHEREVREAEALAKGRYDKNQQVQLREKFNVSLNKPTAGDYQEIYDRDTNFPLYVSKFKKDISPLLETITTIKDGKKVNAIVDKRALIKGDAKDKGILETYEAPPETITPYQRESLDLERDRINAGLGGDKTKVVAAASASEIGELDASNNIIDELEKQYKKLASDYFSGISSTFHGTDANKYKKFKEQAAQSIGRTFEGGKLTDKDYDRYYKMLPDAWDADSVAVHKFAGVRSMLQQLKKGKISGLKDAGYDTSRFEEQSSTKKPLTPLEILEERAKNGDSEAKKMLELLKKSR